ncbi:MAG: hypothetical protein MI924_17730 [Chloroflexales bacterium]|nr:hypothetical protein [Chloroflexales bacterium]
MVDRDNHALADELAACEERIFLAERELELLGWLPTSAGWSILDRLWHERERQSWLLRRWRRRDSTNEDTR